MSKGKFALGAVFGAVAGVVAGVLTAPKSGKETRADIKKKTDELIKETNKKADEARVQGEKIVDETKKRVDTAVAEGRKAVEDYRSRATRAANAAKGEFNRDSDTKRK